MGFHAQVGRTARARSSGKSCRPGRGNKSKVSAMISAAEPIRRLQAKLKSCCLAYDRECGVDRALLMANRRTHAARTTHNVAGNEPPNATRPRVRRCQQSLPENYQAQQAQRNPSNPNRWLNLNTRKTTPCEAGTMAAVV